MSCPKERVAHLAVEARNLLALVVHEKEVIPWRSRATSMYLHLDIAVGTEDERAPVARFPGRRA